MSEIHRSHVWVVNHRGKAHLDPNCRYCPDHATKKPTDVYPDGHIEICEFCQDYHERWSDGFTKSYDTDGCERCGKSVESRFCEDCFTRVVLHR